MAREIAVLGGGVLGLTAALRLQQRGHRVTVFEREAEPGGLAAGFPVRAADPAAPAPLAGGVWLEKFYHHLFRSDRAITRLIAEVGLGDDLVWRRPLTVTLRGGRAYQLDSPLSLLRFAPVPVVGRVRMGAALALLRALPSPAPLEGHHAAPWIRATMGQAAYDAVWGPLLRGKFGAVADEIALPWFWGRIHDRTAELGYVRGGFQRFYDALAARLVALGATLRLGTEARAIRTAGDGLALELAPAGTAEPATTEAFAQVIATLPTRLTLKLAPELPASYRDRYDWGRAYGAHCLILALDRPLTSTYWMNVNDPGYPFMVLVEHTNYMPQSDYGDRHLVYLGNYRAMDDPLFAMDQAAVLAEFLPHLARINPAFDPAWVRASWMFRAGYAQPIVTTDYAARIPPFATPLPGLFVANMFQVYPHDRGQNYSVELAERLVRQVDGAL
ncbi:MAG TPA: NAD(P)/FAD-dependent oxidoreductase [Ktedonobacterales bacterium]